MCCRTRRCRNRCVWCRHILCKNSKETGVFAFLFIHSIIYPTIASSLLLLLLIFHFTSILLLLWMFFLLLLLFSFYFLDTRRPTLAPISKCIMLYTTHTESTTIRFDNDFCFIISTSQWIATVRSAEQFDAFWYLQLFSSILFE